MWYYCCNVLKNQSFCKLFAGQPNNTANFIIGVVLSVELVTRMRLENLCTFLPDCSSTFGVSRVAFWHGTSVGQDERVSLVFNDALFCLTNCRVRDAQDHQDHEWQDHLRYHIS